MYYVATQRQPDNSKRIILEDKLIFMTIQHEENKLKVVHILLIQNIQFTLQYHIIQVNCEM